jgi:hypothetical protein
VTWNLAEVRMARQEERWPASLVRQVQIWEKLTPNQTGRNMETSYPTRRKINGNSLSKPDV